MSHLVVLYIGSGDFGLCSALLHHARSYSSGNILCLLVCMYFRVLLALPWNGKDCCIRQEVGLLNH